MLDVQEIAEARVGRTLRGKWHLDALVGIGGMAAVYRARHRNGACVALKILHPQMAVATELRRRFVREGYVANSIAHPAVVRVLDDDSDEHGLPFLVMDFVEGETLAAKVQRRRLGARELLDVGGQICDALRVAHAAGVVHRDLKPDNLLVEPDGRVRILDFGIARLVEPGTRGGTQTGMTYGTPGFIAPEQALGHRARIGPATDLFALGATLFYLATGEFVHVGETPEELLVRVATVPARALAEVAPWISPEVAAIVDRATRMQIGDRWPSASAMLEAIEAARGASIPNVGSRATEAETLAPPPPSNPAPTIAPDPSEDDPSRTTESDLERASRASVRPSFVERARRRRRSGVATASAVAITVAAIAALSIPGSARSDAPEPAATATISLSERDLPALPALADIAPEAVKHDAPTVVTELAAKPPECPPAAAPTQTSKPKPAVVAHDPHKLLDRLLNAKAKPLRKKK